jgi:flagellar biosynthesis protein FlhF
MSFKRFVAASMREAMTQLRRDLGDDAVILSSRRIGRGQFEILAAASRAVEAIVEEARRPLRERTEPPSARSTEREQSFEDYVRRQGNGPARVAPAGASAYSAVARAQAHDDDAGFDAPRAPEPSAPARPVRAQPAPAAPIPAARAPAVAEPAVFRRRPSRELRGQITPIPDAAHAATSRTAIPAAVAPALVAAPAIAPAPVMIPPAAAAPMTVAQPLSPPLSPQIHVPASPVPAASIAMPIPVAPAIAPAPAASSPTSEQLMAELASLRASLQQQISSLSSSVATSDSMRRNPLQTRVMTRLLTGGFSVDLARRIALRTPPMDSIEEADAWLQEVISLNLRCAGPQDSLIDATGVFALVGPTGVGKTTTVAKLAARFAVKYGASALGLITLDAYRIAAHEQLRAYGRILGVPVHLAQDGATLRELLASMRGRRLVLVDTCGLGPRDDRLGEMLGVLAHAGAGTQKVQPVLLLNASSHAETLDDTARAWGAADAAGTILTKLDEAARIGGALDCALRHKLKLLALTNGQRVPEDIHHPNARLLAHLSLKPSAQHFTLADEESAALASLPAVTGGAAHA